MERKKEKRSSVKMIRHEAKRSIMQKSVSKEGEEEKSSPEAALTPSSDNDLSEDMYLGDAPTWVLSHIAELQHQRMLLFQATRMK